MKPPLLAARGISVERNRTRIVDRVTLELDAASVVTIAGPSGCGKSTFLRAIATLMPVSSGTLELEGRDVHEVGFIEYRRRVAYVAQTPRMFEGTVADNIRTGPRLRDMSASVRDADVALLLERVGLDVALAGRAAADVSAGEQLRVALARALANEPRVLLLDEPTASLDPAAARVVLVLLRALAASGTALLVVTHVEEHAAYLGGRAHSMKRGVLEAPSRTR